MTAVWAVLGAAGVMAGVGAAVAGVCGAWPESPRAAVRDGLARLVSAVPVGDVASLRLAGVTAGVYNAQRIAASLAGLAAGAVAARVAQTAAAPMVLWALAAGCGGWVLPTMSVRDSARRGRGAFEEVVRVWIALTAQQVRAGADPAAAMLNAAEAGRGPQWRLLHAALLQAQHQRRPAWAGLGDVVERYGLQALASTVSALGLAAQRGTKITDAVLAAADSLWQESVSRERERAAKRSQLIVVPATGVALALAAILVYPPFTALTGSGLTTGG